MDPSYLAKLEEMVGGPKPNGSPMGPGGLPPNFNSRVDPNQPGFKPGDTLPNGQKMPNVLRTTPNPLA